MLTQILANTTPPIILISGVGILLLVISNRITHVIDRIRQLASYLDKEEGTKLSALQDQIKIMMKRAHILRISIASLCMSILSSSLILICALLEAFNDGVYHYIGSFLLIISVIGVVVAIAALFVDAIKSLHALKIDIAMRGL